MKIKATLSVLLDNDDEKFYKIQNYYVNHAIIKLDDDKEDESKFTKFLNRDEREEMTL